jgi:predicted Zn finger-like uncharacterized protein
MYTQCPDCSTSFRVTAEVLKQAAGRVRCGGCGNAFNALEYLSEAKPASAPPREAEPQLPELKPDPREPGAGVPESISAAQSAALLKTLDELAGADIRIEDTGVEWRVLDDDEVGEAAGDAMAVDYEVEDQPAIDELLDDSPTPVDQFLTNTPPVVDSPEIFEEEDSGPARTSVDELRFDDNTPLPDDFDLGDASSPAPVAASEPEAESEPEPVVAAQSQADLDLSEPDEWSDILDEFEDLAGDLSKPDLIDELDAAADELSLDEAVDDGEESPLDMDAQFAIQAEAMGIDLSGMHETLDVNDESPLAGTQDLDDLLAEGTKEERDIEELLQEEILDEEEPVEDVLEGELEIEDLEEEDADASAQLELIDEQVEDEYVVPPLTEEEQTVNMQIDADLMAIAVEDEHGFASTMVLEQADIEGKTETDELPADDDDDDAQLSASTEVEMDDAVPQYLRQTDAGFETIIMEGEVVLSTLDEEKQEKDRAAAAAALADASASREAENAVSESGINYRLVAGLAALVLLLVGQALHQARNTLATIPAFNDLVGPMYRAVGQPLSPEWDITGWRFEATRGSTDDGDAILTIYSRVGNKSENPLPYPLIGISLTDRFEETIGSRMLDPAEYLSNDLDPRKLVEPGNTFNAVITIPSPAEEATGFKLNVCYRESDGNLRCAIDDFK